MLRLALPKDPRWEPMGFGVEFLVRPATTALITTARLRARRQMEELRRAAQEAREAGLPVNGPDVSDPDVAGGHAFALTVMALGRELVADWRGVVADDGKPAAFAADLLPQVLSHPDIAERFFAAVSAGPAEVTAEGNA